MRHLFITEVFPSGSDVLGSFVKSVVDNLYRNGKTDIVVCCVRPLHRINHYCLFDNSNGYKVINLPYISIPLNNSKRLIRLQEKFILFSFHIFLFFSSSYDIVYGHFVWPSIKIMRLHFFRNSRKVIASGESVFDRNKLMNVDWSIVDKIISVSDYNRIRLTDLINSSNSDWKGQIWTVPNAAGNHFRFCRLTRNLMRKELGLKATDTLLLFVGHFDGRKNIALLDKALIRLNNKRVKVAYLGEGKYRPRYSQITFQGKVSPNEISKFYNAADLYVSLSSAEGMSNSIIESIVNACPSIIADTAFNTEIDAETILKRVNISNEAEVINTLSSVIKCQLVGINEEWRISYTPPKKYILNNRISTIQTFIYE